MKGFIRNKIREGLDVHDIDTMLNQLNTSKPCDCCKYFDMESISNFGGMVNPIYFMIQKREVNELIHISPKQYIYTIARGFGVSYDDAMGGAYSNERAKKYSEEMKSGAKFPIGYFIEGGSDQEGRHRASAALMLNCNAIPIIKRTEISGNYVHSFVEKNKSISKEGLDTMMKEKGYAGITGLDWREFQNYVNYRL